MEKIFEEGEEPKSKEKEFEELLIMLLEELFCRQIHNRLELAIQTFDVAELRKIFLESQ
ncbi:MAG: hypothetical protein LBM01_04050 [Christensenellaceae bacterium]|jgi:hypothetical protein|nr:hypothetical protein [Christensenellaceae bacterium]